MGERFIGAGGSSDPSSPTRDRSPPPPLRQTHPYSPTTHTEDGRHTPGDDLSFHTAHQSPLFSPRSHHAQLDEGDAPPAFVRPSSIHVQTPGGPNTPSFTRSVWAPAHSRTISIDYFDPTAARELESRLSGLSSSGGEHEDRGREGGEGRPWSISRLRSKSHSRDPPRREGEVTEAHDQKGAATTNESPAESSTANGGLEGSPKEVLAVGEGPFDFERSLRQYIQQRDEEDIPSRELGVLFEGLRVVGMGASASYQKTLGALFNPLGIIENIKNARHPPLRDILAGFEGVVRPGEMLLVLGRPGSGCSTLLKVLANQRKEYHSVEGNLYYDSFTPQQIERHYRGDVQYCPEDDVHFPTLKVGETILFAAKTRTPHQRVSGQTRKQYTRFITDIAITIFGLKHVRNTPVGDASIRGVSGGEKKRVSISEALATRSLLNSWDNSTRGLDASTALEFVRAVKIATELARKTTIVSIYQAGESLYELFDKVCLIYDGRMVYFGPADYARQYFIDMGYQPANRQTTADFLVSVTDPNGRTVRKDFDGVPPRTAEEFEAYYRRSEPRKWTLKDMEAYRQGHLDKQERTDAYKRSAEAEQSRHTRKKSPYTISIPMQVRAVIIRRLQILRGNFTSPALSTATFVLQAVIIGTTFLKIPDATSAFFSRGGVIFFAVFLPALLNMSEIPALFSQRSIVARQQQAAMYHPFIEALALTLVDVPITFVTIVLYTIILYFVIGLQRTAGQYFIFFAYVFIVALSMRAFFRALAAAFKKEAPAQALAGIMLLALSIYTGYQIPQIDMIWPLRWIAYINPLRYAFEGLMVNEFNTLNAVCSNLVPRGPGYDGVSSANQVCAIVGSIPGQERVSGSRFLSLSYDYQYSHLWRNFGIVIAFGIFFVTLLLIFTEYKPGVVAENSILLFKRGSKAGIVQDAAAAVASDSEKQPTDAPAENPQQSEAVVREAQKEEGEALAQQPKMQDIFSWQDITYTIPSGEGPRVLLDKVSGYVAPGKLTALMGESGAGKTTLLNVLAERIDTGVVTGERYVNGHALPPDFKAQTGYCQQTDTHVPTNTVREALRFSAHLRQPRTVPVAEKDAYAEKCLKMCGLEPFADAIVGSLNVENRKRTTIGVELAAKPRLLLFLDEPTSGLDSQSAWAIMTFLRQLANNGQAILCTIHQPSAELFQIFDRLLLLQKGGKTVYFGDLGHNATSIIQHFEAAGSRDCKPGENPAEFILDVIGAGATATTDRDWHEVWTSSKGSQKLQQDLGRIHVEGHPVSAKLSSTYASTWVYQTRELLIRQFQAYWRDPTYLMAKLSLNIIGGLFIGFTFWKSKDTVQGSQNKLFAIFMGTVLSAPLGGQLHVPFIKMRNVYEIREKSSLMYHWSALITSQILVEIPWNVLGSSLFFCCWYWTVGFLTSRAAFTYFLYGFLFPLYYTTIALAIASTAPTAEIAGLLFSFLFSFVLIFDGVVQPYSQLTWWRWMYHLSPFTYLIGGVVGQAIGRQNISCSARELSTLQPPNGQACGNYLSQFISDRGGYVTNPDATSNCLYCAYRTTDEWLGPTFNIYWRHHWRNLGIFCAYILFNTALVYLFTYLFRIQPYSPVKLVKSFLSKFGHKKRAQAN